MVVGRALAVSRCAACRLSLLNSFVSVAAPSFRASEASSSNTSQYAISSRQTRLTSQLANNDRGTIFQKTEEKGDTDEVSLPDLKPSEESSEQTQISAKPWYLQVAAPQKPARPALQRQELPELPEAPPPILQPLLEQLSIDLGLDDLTLLDLRKLDPPPALGANLIMLIGTARSEKHLHVSADRLCRWFRGNYKLRPSADGLLGRNELKMKLRRKAKRAKLLGGAEENADDGIRTGWVCVDVGIVQEAEGAAEIIPPQDFIGFGRRTEGVRLVVQLLTEEKREEIELEKLWNGILKRGGQHKIEEPDDSLSVEQQAPSDTASDNVATIDEPKKGFTGVGQIRGFHTFVRRCQQLEEYTISESSFPDQQIATSPSNDFDIGDIQEGILMLLNSGDYARARDAMAECRKQVSRLQGEEWRDFLLDLLKTHLQNVPRDQARRLLGADDTDYDSTGFLQLFYQTIPASLTPLTAEMKIWLLYYGREIEHPGYNNERLLELFQELQYAGVKLTLSSYTYLLRGILLPFQKEDNFHGPSSTATDTASQVLHTMHDQGLEVLTEDILVNLQEVTSPSAWPENFTSGSVTKSEGETFGFNNLPMPPIQKRIHVLMKYVDLPLFRDDSRMKLMDLYARNNHWLEFFEVFRMAPQHRRPQSAMMYAFMFSVVAHTKNQRACMVVLRTWVPELKQEIPNIELEGDVGVAVRRCIEVAEPFITEDVEDPEKVNNEWVRMWRECR